MAKFTKNIERMIADLRNDEKIQAMHRDNIDHAVARRARRAELCRLFLAAYRYHKNDRRDVVAYDDREAKKAAIKKAIWEKYDGSTLKARMMFLIEVVQGKYNEEFKDLLDEACDEIDEEKAEVYAAERVKNLKDLHKWCESKAEKLARVTGEDKATIIDRLEGRTSDQENKRPTLSLNRAVSKRENKIITVGNKKAYQVGKGDYKHRNGVIIDN